MRIARREYKVMLNHDRFGDHSDTTKDFWTDVLELARDGGIEAKGKLKKAFEQEVHFLDTPDLSVRKNGLVLRRRTRPDKNRDQITLKLRNPDRFIAEGIELTVAPPVNATQSDKLEEDIAAPFRSRYSHSATLNFKQGKKAPAMETLRDAVDIFPVLATTQRDKRKLPKTTELFVVNRLRVRESVVVNRDLSIGKDHEAAVIFWRQHPHMRLVAAEFSFRYVASSKSRKAAQVAKSAMEFFTNVQMLPWCSLQSPTKTQFAYGERS